MTIAVSTKDVQAAAEQSLQPRATVRPSGVTGILRYLAAGSYRVAPWWSPQRDLDLDAFWKDSDHLSGVLGLLAAKVITVPVRVMPRDTRLKRNIEDAERFNILLNEEAEFGAGWPTLLSKWLSDWYCSDNGAFMDIIGPGDPLGPIEGQATGIAHLDSHRIQRTGDREYPALYTRPDGNVIKIHHTRISMSSDNPSAREEMYGVGFCSLSRAIHSGQTLMDLATYKEEKLGSRPKRGILTGKGISTDAILDSLAIADEQMDNRALSIYSQMAVLGDLPPDAALDLLDLISLPDGFDEETSMRLGMFTIATAFGVPIRWIWPASVSGATKADAMYQHIAGLGGGIGRILTTLTLALGGDPNGPYHSIGKFLPPNLYARFDLIDDEQDEQHANIQSKRATILKTQLETGVYDMRTAREYALSNNDLTQAQFDRLELEDGRLPDGSPVLSLFQVDNEPFLSWLDMGVQNPLATSSNNAMKMLEEIDIAAITVQDVIANSTNVGTKAKAEQALSALNALKGLYAPLAQQSVQTDLMAQFGVTPEEPVSEESDAVAEEESAMPPPTEQGEKSFDYGVNAGNIISGQLARGVGGRFINAAELKAQMQQMMLSRMRKGVGQEARNSASDKRESNRSKISEALGIDLNSLAGMIGGETSLEDEQAFVERGLAEINPDGSISMTPAGRKVLSAANSGDVDAVESALAKAKQDKQKADRQAATAKPRAEKPTPEQRARDRSAAQEKAKGENRQRVAEELGGRLPQDQFDALVGFSDGNEPGTEQAQALAQKGLVEIDADGNYRMTAAGNAVMRAANSGDVRAAKDALSAGADRVRRAVERAQQVSATATQYEENGQQTIESGESQAIQYRQAAQKLRAEALTASAPYTERATQLDTQAAQLDTQAAQLDARAMQADTEADIASRELETATPERRDTLQKQIDTLRVTAAKAREEADRKRTNAGDMRGGSLQLREQGRVLQEKMEEQSRAYEKQADRVRVEAAEQAEQWAERAKKMREEAEKLRASVGGGSVTARKGLLDWFKQKRRWNPVPTPKEVDAAIREWDANPDISPEAKGILRAKRGKR